MTWARLGRWLGAFGFLALAACSSARDGGGGPASGNVGSPMMVGSTGGAGAPGTGSTGAVGAGATGGGTGASGAVNMMMGGTGATGSVNMMMGSTGGSPPPPPSGNVWSHMGFDQKNWYFNPAETTISVQNAPMLVEKWRFTVAGFPPGTPIIAEGKVFVMATGGTYAINLADGTMVWSRTDVAGTASLAYENGFLYAHVFTGAKLYKLKASDGMNVWPTAPTTYAHPGCEGTSSPVLGGGKVVVGHSCGPNEIAAGANQAGSRGGVEAFNAEDGSPAWTYWTVPATGENGAMVWSTVAIDLEAGVVFASTGNNYTVGGENSDSIHAINLADGTRKWKRQVNTGDTWSIPLAIAGPDTDFGANPILAEVGGRKIVAAGDKGSSFWALDRQTGDILWSRTGTTKLSTTRNQANGGVLMNGAFDGTNFYVVSNQPPGAAVLHALAGEGGAEVWPAKTLPRITWGATSVANGVLFVPSDNLLLVFNAATGEQLHMFDTGGTIAAGAAAILDGRVVVQSGLQYALDPTVKNNNLIICYGLP